MAVFLGCTLSHNTQVMDSHYTLLTSETVLKHGDVYLERYVQLPLDPKRWPGSGAPMRLPYQIIRVQGHSVYGYLIGSSVLSVPFVAVANLFGASTIASDGQYDAQAEMTLQRRIAAVLAATIALLMFLTARLKLPDMGAFLLTLAFAFGSPLWSTLGIGLWSQVWAVTLLSVLLLHLVAADGDARQPFPWLVALLCALLLFVRSTGLISIVAVGVYLLIKQRHIVLRTIAWGIGLLAVLLTFNWLVFGKPIEPTIYSVAHVQLWRLQAPLAKLAGVLVSPGRGLFVYMPLAAVAVVAPLVLWRRISCPALAIAAYVAIALHLTMLSIYYNWWGGFSFGPRLCSELLPWFFLLAVLALQAWHSTAPRGFSAANVALHFAIAVLIAWSSFVNYRGANVPATMVWNQRHDIDHHPEALWDWSDMPALAN